MARSYDVAAAALALDVPAKWVDNVLSHHDVPGVARQRQGVTRAITPVALLHLSLARTLAEAAGFPLRQALHLATVLLDGQGGEVSLGQGISIRVDRRLLEQQLELQLLRAMEVSFSRRRGRPPGKQTGAGE